MFVLFFPRHDGLAYLIHGKTSCCLFALLFSILANFLFERESDHRKTATKIMSYDVKKNQLLLFSWQLFATQHLDNYLFQMLKNSSLRIRKGIMFTHSRNVITTMPFFTITGMYLFLSRIACANVTSLIFLRAQLAEFFSTKLNGNYTAFSL